MLLACAGILMIAPQKAKSRNIYYSMISWIFCALATLTILFCGNPSDLTGATLLIFAIYIYSEYARGKIVIIIIMILLSVLSTVVRSTFNEWSAASTVKNISGMAVVMIIHFVLIHKKKHKQIPPSEISDDVPLDYYTKDIILRYYRGATRAEIADDLVINPSTVTDKMNKARVKMNARSDMELWDKCRQKGYITD